MSNDANKNDVVDSACRPGTALQANGEQERKLLDLCLHYREPAYAYLRHHCNTEKAALALTAAFFLDLQARAPVIALELAGGRFRKLMLDELKRFLADNAPQPPQRPAVFPVCGKAK